MNLREIVPVLSLVPTLWACGDKSTGLPGSGSGGGTGGSGSETGDYCASASIELSDATLSLSSEGSVYVQASFGLRMDNSNGEDPACVGVVGVGALFGFNQEDSVALQIAAPTDFVLEPGEVRDTEISASAFRDLPPNLFGDHCTPETTGALEITTSGTQMPWAVTVPLPIGCACC